MKKALKWIIKLLFITIFIVISIFVILYALQTIGISTINFDWLNKISFWDEILQVQVTHKISFGMLLFGISGLCAYFSLSLVLSLIPLAGKVIKKIINFLIGWLLLIASIILIIIGSLGVAGIIPNL